MARKEKALRCAWQFSSLGSTMNFAAIELSAVDHLMDNWIVAVVVLLEYDTERSEPAHGGFQFHVPIYFRSAVMREGAATAIGTIWTDPEKQKRLKRQRGRSFVASVIAKFPGVNDGISMCIACQTKVLGHDKDELPLRIVGSAENNDSVKLLYDSDGFLYGAEYTLSKEKHGSTLSRLMKNQASAIALSAVSNNQPAGCAGHCQGN
jgi:hypothetical protein